MYSPAQLLTLLAYQLQYKSPGKILEKMESNPPMNTQQLQMSTEEESSNKNGHLLCRIKFFIKKLFRKVRI